MAISRAQLYKQLIPGLHALFGVQYNSYPEEHKDIYEVTGSTRSFEEETKLTGFGPAGQKLEGAGVDYDTAQEVWTARYTHVTIAQGFALTEEAFEDNQYDSLSARYTKALARSMAYTKQVRAASILNSGFSTTYGDGVNLFSASHPTASGTVNSNLATADLNETSLENAVIAMARWVDERGLLIAAKPKKLIIPVDNVFTAKRILGNPNRPETADRDINALYAMSSIPQGFAVNHWLTDTDGWFLTTDVPDGMKMFVRSSMKRSTSTDFDTGNMKYKARERYSFGVSDPLGIYGAQGV